MVRNEALPDPDVANVVVMRPVLLPAASVAGRRSNPQNEVASVPDVGGQHDRHAVHGVRTGEQDDAALLALTASGDAQAFRRLVERHISGVTAIARGMLRDGSEAQDIAQEAFLRLWRHAGELELGSGGVKPWLRRVVSNMCIDRMRATRNTTVVDEVPERIEPPTQGIALEEHDLAVRVKQALDELPERQRQALTLFHFDGLSQMEICDVLGISEDAVESLLARARRSLKTALKDEWRQLLPDGPTDGGTR